jgi:maltooligosyltrehalose trehalohydrolase
MTRLQVWAPLAREVDVEIQQGRLKLERRGDGWWHIETDLAQPGTDYMFIVDGSKPLPDPRSPWQPSGVHGPSRLIDNASFQWHDEGWQPPELSSALVYELHVGTFTPEGTFDGVIDKLDYLRHLGVTHVELMPVHGFAGSHGWGYDSVDLFAPHEPYGGPDGLKRLVDACHRKDLAIILDVVYNHLGPEGNYLEFFGPYFSTRYSAPWGKAVNLDGPYSDEVRRFFIDNALMWLRNYHFDGLRIDAIHAIVDTSAVHFLEQMAIEVTELEKRLGRRLVLIAESDLNDPRVVWSRDIGGYGLEAQWSDDFHHAIHTLLTGENSGYYEDFGALGDVAKALRSAFVYDGKYSVYRHRSHGRSTVGLSGHRFLGYVQNHDQVGNRACGERLSQLVGVGKLKIASALVMTAPFVPMLFQGEEWGAGTPFLYFTDHQDAHLREAVRNGRREEFAAFGWDPGKIPDPQSEETFRRSCLKWQEQENERGQAMLRWYGRLIELRQNTADLNDGNLEHVHVEYDEAERWLMMVRGRISVTCNFGVDSCVVPLTRVGTELVLSSDARISVEADLVRLPGESVVITMAR